MFCGAKVVIFYKLSNFDKKIFGISSEDFLVFN
jgi:hypothetical protein